MNSQELIIKDELEELKNEIVPKSTYLDNKKEANNYEIFLYLFRTVAVFGALYLVMRVLQVAFNPILLRYGVENSEITIWISAIIGLGLVSLNEYQKGKAIEVKTKLSIGLEKAKDLKSWSSQAIRLKSELKSAKRKYAISLLISVLSTVGGMMLYVYETSPKPELVNIESYNEQEKEELAAIQKKIDWNNSQRWPEGGVKSENRKAATALTLQLDDVRGKYATLMNNGIGQNIVNIADAYKDSWKWVFIVLFVFLLIEGAIVYMKTYVFTWKTLSVIELEKDPKIIQKAQIQTPTSNPIPQTMPTPVIASNSNKLPQAGFRIGGMVTNTPNNSAPNTTINPPPVAHAPISINTATSNPKPELKKEFVPSDDFIDIETKKAIIQKAIEEKGVQDERTANKITGSFNSYKSKCKTKPTNTNVARLIYWGMLDEIVRYDNEPSISIPVFFASDFINLPYDYSVK